MKITYTEGTTEIVHDETRYLIYKPLGSAFLLEYEAICCIPLCTDNTFDTEEVVEVESWEDVEEDSRQFVLNFFNIA